MEAHATLPKSAGALDHCPISGDRSPMRTLLVLAVLISGCAASQKPALPPPPDEPHLAGGGRLRQGGQNAEAYWAFDGSQLSFQARRDGEQCDRILRMRPAGTDPEPVSSGKG